jgi:hypothetical protein
MQPDPFNAWGLKDWPKGGAGIRRKADPVPESAADPIPVEPAAPPEQKPLVRLLNPKWSVEEANFEDKVGISVEAVLPESLKDIKRLIVTVFSITSQGIRSQIKSKDLYVDEGLVKGEFELSAPAREGDKVIESCEYLFTAKHRDSKEVESPRLHAKAKPRGNDELILEVPSSDDLKKGGHSFRLKSNDGTIICKIETKNVQEKDGTLTFKFEKLDPKLRYALDFLDSQDRIVDTIFSDMPFGRWAEVQK